MRSIRIGPIDVLLLAVCTLVVVANAWFVVRIAQDGFDVNAVRASVDDALQNVRRLRSIDDSSAARQDLATILSQQPAGEGPVVQGSIDELQLVYGLLDFIPQTRVKLVGFRAQEVKTQTIDTESFRLLGYDITLEGDPYDMLSLVQRVDQNSLQSLTIPVMTLTRDEQGWHMKATVIARLHSASQPVLPTKTPTVKPASPPTPTPARR